jgi:AraC-type DNA-binding domain-containing proteins
MGKDIKVLLPAQAIEDLEFKHNFILNRIGYYEKIKHHHVKRTDLDEAILILCLDGRGYVNYKDKKYDINSGDVVFLEAHVPHEYGSKSDDPWTILWVHFSGDGVSGYTDLLRKYNIDNIFHIEKLNGVAEELNNLLLLFGDNYNSIDIHKACCVLQMVLLSFVENHSQTSLKHNLYVNKAISFMKSNVYANIDLKAISKHLRISTFHIIRVFKLASLPPPMQYYNTMRINEAAKLLLSTNLTVSEISGKLNYSSQFLFSQQFKKKMGCSPTSYKELMHCKY